MAKSNSEDQSASASGNWVFGYGSLMWKPGFSFEESHQATLMGYHRSLCIRSFVHRGTPECPGLVLGLNAGGSCQGIAFRVADGGWEDTVAYLREREQATAVYLERQASVVIPALNNREVQALTYVADTQHEQFAGDLALEEMIALVRQGHGQAGANPEYVINTALHLKELGVEDKMVEAVAEVFQSSAGVADS